MSNEGIIEELLSTAEYYETNGDNNRYTAYKRAVDSIRECGFTIKSGEDAKQLKWIGDSISSQIDNILGSGGTGRKKSSRIQKPGRKTTTKCSDNDDKYLSSKKVAVTLIDDIRSKAKKRDKETSIDTIDIRKGRRKPLSPLTKSNSLNPSPTPKSKINKKFKNITCKTV